MNITTKSHSILNDLLELLSSYEEELEMEKDIDRKLKLFLSHRALVDKLIIHLYEHQSKFTIEYQKVIKESEY